MLEGPGWARPWLSFPLIFGCCSVAVLQVDTCEDIGICKVICLQAEG